MEIKEFLEKYDGGSVEILDDEDVVLYEGESDQVKYDYNILPEDAKVLSFGFEENKLIVSAETE